jgi:hypothetical protein
MKARLIKEYIEFNRDGDNPIHKMNIGITRWENLKEMDIIKSNDFIIVQDNGSLKKSDPKKDSDILENDFCIIKKISYKGNNSISMELIPVGDGKISTIRRIINDPHIDRYGAYQTWDAYDNFSKYFKIVDLDNLKESISFNRSDKNVFTKLGIGISKFETLKRGDVLKPKKLIHIGKRTQFIPKDGTTIWNESYVLVIDVERTPMNNLKVWYYQCWDLEELKKRKEGELVFPTRQETSNSMTGTIKQFENRFKII